MLALNWFETFLPAEEFSIQVENFSDIVDVPERVSTLHHETVLRKVNGTTKRYHVTSNLLESAQVETFEVAEDAALTKHLLERGFALRLAKAGFEVRLHRVGGTGLVESLSSLLPNVYQSFAGLRYRAFYFVDERGVPQRWGMVLNFTTRQRFVLTLADPRLQRLAKRQPVVPVSSANDSAPEPRLMGVHSFVGVRNSSAVLEDRNGEHHTVPLNQWTLPANKWTLHTVVKDMLGGSKANQVTLELDRNALTLTANGHINKSLARDQVAKVRNLLRGYELVSFRLPLRDEPSVRMSDSPLELQT